MPYVYFLISPDDQLFNTNISYSCPGIPGKSDVQQSKTKGLD